jgi:hypothetical protein
MINKGKLNRMRLTVFREAFDGCDALVLDVYGKSQTREDGGTVDKNCTGSARS